MNRVDVHSHFLPDFYRDALEAAGLGQADGIAALPQWSEVEAIETMDRLGIDTAFLSISSPGVHFGDDAAAGKLARRVNEEAARIVANHPGRFGFFASTPLPDIDGAIAEVRVALDELGADGVVLETNFHGVYLGDSLLEPLYAELDRRSAIVFIHPTSPHCPCCRAEDINEVAATAALGYPRPMLEFMFETTRSVTNLILSGALERHPNIRVLVPHAGAALPVLAGRIELLLPMLTKSASQKTPSVRSALRQLHFDLAGAPVPELLGALLQVADPDRIHYGSDWPFTPADICRELLNVLEGTELLNPNLQRNVMCGNALRLFPRFSALLNPSG